MIVRNRSGDHEDSARHGCSATTARVPGVMRRKIPFRTSGRPPGMPNIAPAAEEAQASLPIARPEWTTGQNR
jgi:hypothetical protein